MESDRQARDAAGRAAGVGSERTTLSDIVGSPTCPRCEDQRLEPAGEAARPYWWCPDCGPLRIDL